MREGLFKPAEAVFRARSVALVGASETAGLGMARQVYRNLEFAGFPTELFLVNPRRDEIWGRPCYPSLAALPKPVDLAIMVIPGGDIPDVLEAAATSGLKSALIFASYFGENGDAEGRARAARLRDLAERTGIRICGPNCQGSVAARERLYFYPSPRVRDLPAGPVGAIFQSGGTFMYWLQHGAARGLGFSYGVTSGNELDLDLADYINFMVEDPSTRVIACMVEGVRRPAAFIAAAEKALEAGKPIVMVKLGRSERGAETAASHTGALAGDDRVFDAVCLRYGIIRCHTLDQMMETALVLQAGRLPRAPRAGGVFYSGGAKGLFLDYADEAGTALSALSAPTVAALAPLCDSGMKLENPLDAGAGAGAGFDKFCRICEVVAQDPDVGVLAFHAQLPLAESDGLSPAPFRKLADSTDKPLIAASRMAQNVTDYSRGFQEQAGIPFVQGLHHAVNAINGMVHFVASRARQWPALTAPDRKVAAPHPLALLAEAGVAEPESRLAATPADAGKHASAIGFPLALKIISPQASHKTEVGGVALGLTSSAQVVEAAEAMRTRLRSVSPGAEISGYLLQRMVQGLEVLVGFREDPGFGPYLLLGLGGVQVEALRDIACRMLPVEADDIVRMIAGLRGAALFRAFRGQPPRDVPALARAVVALSEVFLRHRNVLTDLEINPLMVGFAGEGVRAVDVRLVARTADGSH